MLEKLLNSKIRTDILALFFRNQDKELYTQEIINMADTDPANTHRELKKLKDLILLKSKRKNGKIYFYINKDSEYYKGLELLFKTYNELEGEEKFIVLEDMPDYSPILVANAWCAGCANKFFKEFGFKNRYSKLLAIYDNNYGALCVVKDEFNKLSQEIIDKFISEPESGDKYNELVIDKHKELFRATHEYLKINLSNLSNKGLYQTFTKYNEILEDLHRLHWIQTTSDFGENLFSKYLLKYLKQVIDHKKYSVGDVFSILTTPLKESYASFEYQDLLKILQKIEKSEKVKKYFSGTETRIIDQNLEKIDKGINDNINQHVKKYGWMGFGLIGPAWERDYFIDILSSFIRQKINPDKLIQKYKDDRKELIKKQKDIYESAKIDEAHKRLFNIAQDLVYTKGIRKDAMFYYFYALENMHKEIAKRFYLSLNQVRYLYPHEYKELLLKKKYDAEVLNSRYRYSIYYSTGHYSEDLLLEGDKARKFIKKLSIIKENIEDVKLLQGDCASSGRARGEVKLVNTVEDIKKMKEGNVLVSIATNPNLVPAIKKAAAIVTDIGGITCHAAIISRELGIPCVIGTRIATKVLKDSDIIDVDATHGKVTIIEKK